MKITPEIAKALSNLVNVLDEVELDTVLNLAYAGRSIEEILAVLSK